MVGYDGWALERFTFGDATIPLLADGFKWLGYSKRHGFLWNVGYYNDVMSKGQSFSSYSSQEVVRVAWLPVHSEEEGTLFHIGYNFRYGKPVDGQLQLRSRPEASTAPYFIDTGNSPQAAHTARDMRRTTVEGPCSSAASTTSSMSTPRQRAIPTLMEATSSQRGWSPGRHVPTTRSTVASET
jgi:hypothetical protein